MKKLIVSLVAVCLTAVLVGGCNRQPSAPAPTPQSDSSQAYADTPGAIIANGTIVPARHLQLSFQVSGQITGLTVEAGDTVQADQVLAKLEGRESLEANVAAAELAVLNTQQALDDLNRNAAMAKAQAQADGVAAKKALDDALTRRLLAAIDAFKKLFQAE